MSVTDPRPQLAPARISKEVGGFDCAETPSAPQGRALGFSKPHPEGRVLSVPAPPAPKPTLGPPRLKSWHHWGPLCRGCLKAENHRS